MNTPSGLTTSEVKKFQAQYGSNVLNHRRDGTGWLRIFLRQFTSPFVYVVFAAAFVSGVFLHDVVDASVITIAVLMNALLGFVQEFKAEKSLTALKNLLTPTAKVIRDGMRQIIPARELVPGDLVILEIGSTVPADGMLVDADSLTVNEAILTGESMPVQKQAEGLPTTDDSKKTAVVRSPSAVDCSVSMGTTVASGIGSFVVREIGEKTRMGKIAQSLTKTTSRQTPMQQRIASLSRMLTIVVLAIAVSIAVLGSATGRPPVEMFELGTAIAIAAIPEGLPVTLTVLLALGMQRIHKRKALVRELVAAETLGSVTTICADKTGTLTEGKMRVVGSITKDGGNSFGLRPSEALTWSALLCNDLRDPLETAMNEWARRTLEDSSAGGRARDITNQFPRLDELPFSPATKYIATLHKMNNKSSPSRLLLVSGAPEVLLEKTTLSKKEKQEWYKKFEQIGAEGLRLVAFSFKTFDHRPSTIDHSEVADLEWLGILTFEDPIRAGVAQALRTAQQLGLKIRVITGDYLVTTQAVIRKLGVSDVVVHARVTPEEKLKIVTDLQKNGEVVAMTGDGVNDAPALKKADIGIVVAGASDVSKETADMVLLDNNFSTIVTAIIEGRSIHVRLKSVLTFLLSDSFAGVTLISLGLLLGFPAPMLAIQLLWVNIISDGLPGMALTAESTEEVSKNPTNRREGLLTRPIQMLIASASCITGLAAFGMFVFFLGTTGNLMLARTISFAILGTSTLFSVFSIRSLSTPIWRINHFSNPWLAASVVAGWILQLYPIYMTPFARAFGTVPLMLGHWIVITCVGVVTVMFIELVKWKMRSRPGPRITYGE